MPQVLDDANALTGVDRDRLAAELAQLESSADVELIVSLVDAVPGREFRVHAVATRHRLCQRPNRSLALVLAIADRHAELATSPAFAGILSQDASSDLLRRVLVPEMRAGRTAEGILATFRVAVSMLTEPVPEPAPPAVRSRWPKAIGAAVLLGLVGLFAWFGTASHRCQRCGAWGVVRKPAAEQPAPGRRNVTISCPKCGSVRVVTETVRSPGSGTGSSSSSDSGSSGWGGGSDSGSSDSGGSDGGGGADW